MTHPSHRSHRPAVGLATIALAVVAMCGRTMAADPELQTAQDLLKDSRFRSAYVAALGPKAKLTWAARLSNSAPIRPQTFEAVVYQVATPCKPHDCADHNLMLLYAPASGRVYGHLHEAGRVTLIGQPSPALGRELGRLWKQEFRQQ